MANLNLRPMTVGEVLDHTFRLYKNNFWLFAGIMSLPFFALFVFNVGFTWLTQGSLEAIRAGGAHAAPQFSMGTIFAAIGGAIIVLIVTFILSGAGQAATIFAVSDLYLGRPATIRGSFAKVSGHIGQALGVIFLVGLIVGVGCIFLIIPGIILACRTAVAVPAAMLEDESAGTAIGRSFDLTKGFAMQMFLIFLLTWVLGLIVGAIFEVPFSLMTDATHPHVLPLGLIIMQHVASFLSQVLVAPIGGIAFSLMYYNLRVRKEAFDLEHLMGALGTGSASSGPAPTAASPA